MNQDEVSHEARIRINPILCIRPRKQKINRKQAYSKGWSEIEILERACFFLLVLSPSLLFLHTPFLFHFKGRFIKVQESG